MTYKGQWHGKNYYFGLHYDLHAGKADTEIGTRCSPEELVPMLQKLAPDFVQTDCKGHPGYTSWFSQTPEASIPPELKADVLAQWRAATKQLGMPLHCHYSGIWDAAAGAKHPEWCTVAADGRPAGAPFGQNAGTPTNEKMCPRSPYLDELMIPQMIELIDRYEVDGFWIDGDLWATEPCYCERCRAAFTAQTGIAEPPTETDDANWPRWWQFTLHSFYAYVTRYCDAVHNHKPGVLVCSNWLQTFRNPGEPAVPTDWISGDNAWVWGLDGSRCEARFLSTRGKHWDIMLWSFYSSHGMGDAASPWTFKPPQMLMQEAAVLQSFGGAVQIYENSGVRDGRLVPWRIEQLREVGQFVQARRELCQDTVSVPQIAILHSEYHAHAMVRGKNMMWNIDTAPVQGALFALLENHYCVDILDEWALLPRLAEFPMIVAPEQHAMSEAMVGALQQYVRNGGKLLLSGAPSFERFGAEFLGTDAGQVEAKKAYHIPATQGEVEMATPLYSEQWRLLEPTSASSLAQLGRTQLRDDDLLDHPAAIVNRVGEGAVAYIPADVFRDFSHNHYPLARVFINNVVCSLDVQFDIEVQAPLSIDVALRRKEQRTIVHLVNRSSGIPNTPHNGAIDEIPTVGPVVITMHPAHKPQEVLLAFEPVPLNWNYDGGNLTITVPRVHIHAAVIIR